MRSLILIFNILFLSLQLFASGNLKIYFLDVGQGDCTLVVTPNNKVVLIDCNVLYQSRPISVLSSLTINTCDFIIATHADDDHVGGLPNFISSFGSSKVRTCLDHGGTYPAPWLSAAASTPGGRNTINPGTNIILEPGISMFCMAAGGRAYDPTLPSPHVTGQLDSSDNGLSCVVLIRYGNFDCWVGGDVTMPVEDGCINAINDPSITGDGNVTLYHVDHHGSANQTEVSFLAALNPFLSVISSGDGYGHPTQTVINKLEAVNPFNYIYCTEAEGSDGGTLDPARGVRVGGDVDLETDGNNVWVNGIIKISGSIGAINKTPAELQNNGIFRSTIETIINLSASAFSNVSLDWSSLGGITNEKMYDDGTHGDKLSGDLIYTFTNVSTTKAPGLYNLRVILAKTNGTNIVQSGTITVIEDTFPPVADYFIVNYTNQMLCFRWKDPSVADLKKVQLRYRMNSSFPPDPASGTALYTFTSNVINQEYEKFSSDFQFYNRYYFSLFLSDYKNNLSRLDQELLVVPVSLEDPVFISDNFVKPDEKEDVEFIFDPSVRKEGSPRVDIYNMNGLKIKSLRTLSFQNVITWDLTNQYDAKVGSGIYIALINLPDKVIRKKILIIR